MAWKCKECGGEVIGYGSGQFTGSGPLNKEGNIIDFEMFQIEESQTDYYICDTCLKEVNSIKDMAYWEE